MDHQDVVKPYWQRLLLTNVQPTLFQSKDLNYLPCGSENPKPTLEISLTRQELLLLVYFSLMSLIPLPLQEDPVQEMLVVLEIELSTNF